VGVHADADTYADTGEDERQGGRATVGVAADQAGALSALTTLKHRFRSSQGVGQTDFT